MYFPWLTVLPASIEVCPIQYPGHGTRVGEVLLTSVPEIVQQAAGALQTYFDRPYALFGHSLGALVCFELARFVTRQGLRSPSYLFVSGHSAAHLPDTYEHIHAFPEAEFIERLRNLNGTPEDVLQNNELRELLLPILRSDFKASETYVYRHAPKFNFPVCACGGLQDEYVSREGLEAWREHTSQGFSARLFPGDHFYLNNPNTRTMLLQVIARELSLIPSS
jgi:medium-chain acyl-[acyl-carrier-protein] hydrolase